MMSVAARQSLILLVTVSVLANHWPTTGSNQAIASHLEGSSRKRQDNELDHSEQQNEEPLKLSHLAQEASKLSNHQHFADRELPPTGSDADEQQATANPLVWAHDRRLFAIELLRILHEQYAGGQSKATPVDSKPDAINNKEDRHQVPAGQRRQAAMSQLLGAIGADGDLTRLTDWLQNSFNLASLSELTTQFVVSKLGSVNCAALVKPDAEEQLVPRFLLFNEHFVDVPYELAAQPTGSQCLQQGKFDPMRKTVLLIHGYLTGYTLIDGLTNIKNRLMDINRVVNERSMAAFEEAAARSNQESAGANNTGSYVLTGDLEAKIRSQKYNVIIVDWFSGANPVPRANYIKAAANARSVGHHIARFLMNLVARCRTPSTNIQIIAHSLGCHVAGFTGKAMNEVNLRLAKITHLDPIGLCFGRLFSEPKLRLSPSDALETRAVHVSLNLFDNPLDGAQSNFLVNGGRDQMGCGGQSELKNSTTSSVSLLYDPNAKFSPCSHLRALSLFEDDLSSEPAQCQVVGYRCATYDRFLAGKCGRCDAMNGQCRLMSLDPVAVQFNRLQLNTGDHRNSAADASHQLEQPPQSTSSRGNGLVSLVREHKNGSIVWVIGDQELNEKMSRAVAKLNGANKITIGSVQKDQLPAQQQQPSGQLAEHPRPPQPQQTPASSTRSPYKLQPQTEHSGTGSGSSNELSRRSDRRLSGDRIQQTLDKLRADTLQALASGWTSIKSVDPKYKVSSLLNLAPTLPSLNIFSGFGGAHQQQQPSPGDTTGPADQHQQPEASGTTQSPALNPPTPVPIGGQALPPGHTNGPLYFVGTSSMSPYCVNYYQFRLLIAESRLNRLLQANRLAPNRLAHISAHGQEHVNLLDSEGNKLRQATLNRDLLHLTVKLSDSGGHFFKGFTLMENARVLPRAPASELIGARGAAGQELMVELTMLLNTTRSEPVRISETIISYYFHSIVLADTVEVNYMSNISPDVRARYSSTLCPVAINDQHQLVKYIECNKIGPNAKR